MNIVLIYGSGELNQSILSMIKRDLEKFNIDYQIFSSADSKLVELQSYIGKDTHIIVVGGDRVLLQTLLKIGDRRVSVIPLAGIRTSGFFTVRGINEFQMILLGIIRKKYKVKSFYRLIAIDGDIKLPPAFNDIVLLNSNPGKLIRYTLYINGEYIWNDTSDGVIVATPVGSTGYSLSAGGPIIKDHNAVSIVSINSLFPTHKPIVTSINSRIQIVDLMSNQYILLIDGQYRHQVINDSLSIVKSRYPIDIIDFPDVSSSLDTRLSTRGYGGRTRIDLSRLPPSSKFVYKVLEYEGGLTFNELVAKTRLPPRTVRHALKILIDKGIIEKSFLDKDARIGLYRIKR